MRRARSSPRAERSQARGPAWLGLLLLAVSWALLHAPFFAAEQIVDTPVYERYGKAVLDGRVPYRDFDLEYPPAALPVFVLPALAGWGDYAASFDRLMLACAAAAVVFLALALAFARAGPARLYGACAFAGLAPLALGSLVVSRYDFWPAALTTAALAAFAARRNAAGFAALALAVAAKVYAVVLLPIAFLHVARASGRRAAARATAVFALVLALAVLPFVLLAPAGVAASLERQGERPLQVESLGAAILLALAAGGAHEPEIVSSHGSQNVAGETADALAAVQSVLQVAAVAAVWLVVWRAGSARVDRLFAGSAAAVAAFVAFGKVLSPQYLVWLVPLVPLVAGAAGFAASALLAAALLLTQLWFPSRYWELVALDPAPAWLVLARDLVLVALFALLLLATRRGSGEARTG